MEVVKPHALLIPLPPQGHIVPLFRLALRLSRSGVTVSFACVNSALSSVRAKYSDEELQKLDIHLLGCDEVPVEDGDPKLLIWRVINALRIGLQPLLEKLDADRLSGVAIPTCIVSDFLLPWTKDFASRLKLPRYMFLPSGAILARFYQVLPELYEQGKLSLGETNQLKAYDGVVEFPGAVPLKFLELPLSLRAVPELSKLVGKAQASARGVVINTFYDLESTIIEACVNDYKSANTGNETNGPKIFPIGPMVTTGTFTDVSATKMEETGAECLKWLDTQPASSVLFICLGSMVHLLPQQITPLALALQSTGLRFLWVLPRGKGNFEVLEDVLPKDFVQNVEGRGLVTTGWVPQFQVLAHQSILGFLSHCGWSSTMESLTLGVPMIGWPQTAEQFLNCRFLVDVLKVARELQRGDDRLVERKEFETAFTFLAGGEGTVLKERMQQLKSKASAALAPGGSSEVAFLQWVDDIKSLPCKN